MTNKDDSDNKEPNNTGSRELKTIDSLIFICVAGLVYVIYKLSS